MNDKNSFFSSHKLALRVDFSLTWRNWRGWNWKIWGNKKYQSKNIPFTKNVTFVVVWFSPRVSTAQESVLPSSHPVTSKSSIWLTPDIQELFCGLHEDNCCSPRVMLTSVTSLMFLPSVKVYINSTIVIFHQPNLSSNGMLSLVELLEPCRRSAPTWPSLEPARKTPLRFETWAPRSRQQKRVRLVL